MDQGRCRGGTDLGVAGERGARRLSRSRRGAGVPVDERSDDEFLEHAYRVLLGRTLDESGRSFYGAMLDRGTGRDDVLMQISTGDEAITRKLLESFALQNLRELRPQSYEDAETRDGVRVPVYRMDSAADVDWLEQALAEHGFHEKPGLFNLQVDDDKRRVALMVALLGPARALELGSLQGAMLRAVMDRGVDVEGIETLPHLVRHAPAELRQRIHKEGVSRLELDGHVDVVFAIDSLPRLNPRDVDPSLRKLCEVLQPGGFLFATIPAWGDDPVQGTIFEPLLQSWDDDTRARRPFTRILVDHDGYPLHGYLTWADPGWWAERLTAAGLRREPDVERALHDRFDSELEQTPARKAFFVYSKDAGSDKVRETVERIRSGAAATPGHAQRQFESIYDIDEWQGGSGQGSLLEHTAPYRRLLQLALRSSDVRSVVDVGCGDWQFSRTVDWSGVDYLGVDIVCRMIEANTRRYAGAGIAFACMDVLTHDPPVADMLIAKDVLQHWPNDEISRFLQRISGRYRYVLLTNDIRSHHWPDTGINSDIRLGAWRTVDLERTPFAVTPLWRGDYEIAGGEWVKRVLLLADRRTLRRPRSAALRLRLYGRRALLGA